MHLAYIDDSGDSKHGVTLTAILVEDRHWAGLLGTWLDGRRKIHEHHGVEKNTELHATKLFKGRSKMCEEPEQDAEFDRVQRGIAASTMLATLARFEHFTVLTVGTKDVSKPLAYARCIAKLEDWAAENNTFLMVFYDGQQGLTHPDDNPTPEELSELWTMAVRNATPYRRVHRDLDLTNRRIIEDVMMQDSKYSQLIQAADLIAYGAFQRHLQDHPEIWGTSTQPWSSAIKAYMKLATHWDQSSDNGVFWLDD